MLYWKHQGKYQKLQQTLFNELVHTSGPTGTVGGEALRASAGIYYDCYNNGFGNNKSGHYNFLKDHFLPLLEGDQKKTMSRVLDMLEDKVNCGRYIGSDCKYTNMALDDMVDIIVEFIRDNPEKARAYSDIDCLNLRDPDNYDDDDEEDY